MHTRGGLRGIRKRPGRRTLLGSCPYPSTLFTLVNSRRAVVMYWLDYCHDFVLRDSGGEGWISGRIPVPSRGDTRRSNTVCYLAWSYGRREYFGTFNICSVMHQRNAGMVPR